MELNFHYIKLMEISLKVCYLWRYNTGIRGRESPYECLVLNGRIIFIIFLEAWSRNRKHTQSYSHEAKHECQKINLWGACEWHHLMWKHTWSEISWRTFIPVRMCTYNEYSQNGNLEIRRCNLKLLIRN
jgi:hypothetical protein